MVLTIYNLISRNCFSAGEKLETVKFSNCKGNFHRSVPNGKRGLSLKSIISDRIFWKITVTFDFQSKFPEFWLNCKHPSFQSLV